MIKDIIQYRRFVLESIKNDFLLRFSRNRFGFVWVILSPLVLALVYTLILSNFLSAKLDGIDNQYSYSIYLLSGLLAWNYFSEMIAKYTMMFVVNGESIKKINYPKKTIPIVCTGVGLVNYTIFLSIVMIILLFIGHDFGLETLWLFPITFLLVLFSLGFGLILGVLNVFLRDIGEFLQIILQLWFWFTPIIYNAKALPEKFSGLIHYNPFFYIISCYHDVIAYNVSPNPKNIFISFSISVLLIIIGLFIYRKSSNEFVDVL
ncbi:ABC transporter permease [Vibrio cholerae]|uniref:ABC transporter permease n=1 Tax=Vibrio cholerae TaxID=666 RepID=UPI0004E2A436|nr:ABC transporter permease [Vibrio cholerae]EGR1088993.1 ABC transporter permease [Vibrio cholerae]KFE23449.1 ABC-2 type transporter family protein [Vibrio cholerae]TXZ28695.1 ABC transporter permease [Vibrio cholerae]BCK27008.1 Teichoic acid translocation permease protein TagG [Vibrio cholerae]BCN21478.1 putative O-antigen ABC transporter permease [Vibrio cholerae]